MTPCWTYRLVARTIRSKPHRVIGRRALIPDSRLRDWREIYCMFLEAFGYPRAHFAPVACKSPAARDPIPPYRPPRPPRYYPRPAKGRRDIGIFARASIVKRAPPSFASKRGWGFRMAPSVPPLRRSRPVRPTASTIPSGRLIGRPSAPGCSRLLTVSRFCKRLTRPVTRAPPCFLSGWR